MRGLAAWLLFAAVFALSWGGRAEVSEQQLGAARALAEAGLELFDKGDYAAAYQRFAGAEAIYHAPPHVLYMARSLARQGKLVAAREPYTQLANESLGDAPPPAFSEAKDAAAAELAALEQRIPRLTVMVHGPPADQVRVEVDGVARNEALGQEMTLDPGAHDLLIRAPGFAEQTQSVELSEGLRERVVLNLVAGGDGSTSPLVGPVVLLSIGGAGLAVAAIMGGLAVARADELTDLCPERSACPRENKSLEDDARTLGAVSTVSFVAGGAVAVGGLVWLLVAWPDGKEQADAGFIRPTFAGGQLGLELLF